MVDTTRPQSDIFKKLDDDMTNMRKSIIDLMVLLNDISLLPEGHNGSKDWGAFMSKYQSMLQHLHNMHTPKLLQLRDTVVVPTEAWTSTPHFCGRALPDVLDSCPSKAVADKDAAATKCIQQQEETVGADTWVNTGKENIATHNLACAEARESLVKQIQTKGLYKLKRRVAKKRDSEGNIKDVDKDEVSSRTSTSVQDRYIPGLNTTDEFKRYIDSHLGGRIRQYLQNLIHESGLDFLTAPSLLRLAKMDEELALMALNRYRTARTPQSTPESKELSKKMLLAKAIDDVLTKPFPVDPGMKALMTSIVAGTTAPLAKFYSSRQEEAARTQQRAMQMQQRQNSNPLPVRAPSHAHQHVTHPLVAHAGPALPMNVLGGTAQHMFRR